MSSKIILSLEILINSLGESILNKSKIISNLENFNFAIKNSDDKFIKKKLNEIDQVNDLLFKILNQNKIESKDIKNISNKYKELIKKLKNNSKNNNKSFIKKVAISTIGATALITSLINPFHQINKNSNNNITKIEKNISIDKNQKNNNNNSNLNADNNYSSSKNLKINPNYYNIKKIENNNDNQEDKLSNNEGFSKYYSKNLKINPKFYDTQKEVFKKYLEEFNLNKIFIRELINSKLIKNNNLNTNLNPRLKKIIIKLSKEENISSKLVFYMTFIESTYGKSNTSKAGARGPLQAMPNTMKDNCKEYIPYFIKKYGKNNWEKEFNNDLYIQLKAGIREIKKICKAYSIDPLKYNVYDLIQIAGNYNYGLGRMKRNPQFILGKSETNKYINKILTLYFLFS